MPDSTKPDEEPVKLTIADTKSAYEVKSTKASDIVRQLSLAGIGLIWVFKVGEAKDAGISLGLLRGALFIFAALTFDLLQYLVGTVAWYLYFRRKEKSDTRILILSIVLRLLSGSTLQRRSYFG